MLITDSESSYIIFTQAVDSKVKVKIPVSVYHAMKVHRWSGDEAPCINFSITCR
jgi:hypothetical protein